MPVCALATAVVALAGALGGTAAAAESDPGYGDEMLLFEEIPSVFGASRYEQKLTDAPSLVTIVTAEDIERYGYRTVDEVLDAVGGVFTTYDRSYHYLGFRGFAPVGHREAAAGPVGGHVDADMVVRPAASGPGVPGREDGSYEGDDGDGAAAVVGDAVDIPPRVAVGRDLEVEVRSVNIASAACLPERVAIGTPAPGCAPPPAR